VRDLPTLLRDALPPDRPALDLTAVRGRSRALGRRRTLTGAAGAAVAVATAGALVLAGQGTPSDEQEVLLPPATSASASPPPDATPGPSPSPSPSEKPVEQPSQSRAEARRDGVVPAIAALPLRRRMQVVEQVKAPEGVWVLSRIPDDTGPYGNLGARRGTYGRDRVYAPEYGELLLLDAARQRVLRAYPLPGVPPTPRLPGEHATSLLLRPDAVYCGRQGDGGLPTSMLCRVDRDTLRGTVRLFVAPADDAAPSYLPAGWTVDSAPTEVAVFEELLVCGGALCTKGHDGRARFDPLTLELTD